MVRGGFSKMKTEEPMTLEEIREAGLKALLRELGPVGMVRFLQQFETGKGNYSVERHEWLDKFDVDTIVQEIQKRQNI
jgi:hypothetical protein